MARLGSVTKRTDEYSRLAACRWLPVLQGISDTEISVLASCSVEGNEVDMYYRIQNYYCIGSECCIKGLWLVCFYGLFSF